MDCDSPYPAGLNAGEIRNWEFTVEMLADFCASTNPRFNRQRWLDYVAGKCGPSGGKLGS